MIGLHSQAPEDTLLHNSADGTSSRPASLNSLDEVAWPFAFVVGNDGRPTDWVALHAPIVSPGRQELFARLRRQGSRFVGFSSDGHFPAGCGGGLDYLALCEAWCHCFRDPGRIFPPGTPLALISDSDFTDPSRVSGRLFHKAASSFDVIHVGAAAGWKREAKNWPLARVCLLQLTKTLNLSCLVVGVEKDEELARAGIVFVPELPWKDFMKELASARLLLVASIDDASPRILAESLCLNTPVLVNRAIIGGWKYVNTFTGSFFTGRDDVVQAAIRCLLGRFHARAWFAANYGPVNAGQRLCRLLSALDPALARRDRLHLQRRLSGRGRH